MLKTAIQKASVEQLGYVEHRQKSWISDETIQLSNRAKEARLNNAAEFRILRRQATRSARNDRTLYWSNIAAEMERASTAGDFSRLFQLIRNSSGTRHTQQPLLRDKHGDLISGHDGKMRRWVEYFEQLLNHPTTPMAFVCSDQTSSPYNINLEPPSQTEVALSLIHIWRCRRPSW
jgi:hypothetical protein